MPTLQVRKLGYRDLCSSQVYILIKLGANNLTPSDSSTGHLKQHGKQVTLLEVPPPKLPIFSSRL